MQIVATTLLQTTTDQGLIYPVFAIIKAVLELIVKTTNDFTFSKPPMLPVPPTKNNASL